jgi:KDO2-lipid IV(A) lauroyltransferase
MEQSPSAIRALARENYLRICENLCCGMCTVAMNLEELRPHCEVVGAENFLQHREGDCRRSIVVAIGHFGNFELYAHLASFIPGFQGVTTYRSLRQPKLNRLMQSRREQTGTRYFERRTEGAALRACMKASGMVVGFLSDQSAGRSGHRLPFMGHLCSTTTAPAIFALRYNCPLHTAICYRTGLARWRIEIGEEIPTRDGATRRSVDAIALDMNRAFEAAVRRDPANWFWVHNRWK